MENLSEFISKSKARLKAILEKFEWTGIEVLKDSQASQTSVSPTGVAKVHEPNFPPNCANKNSVVLSTNKLQELLHNPAVQMPQRFSDLQLNFSRSEKLVIYEYTTGHKSETTPLVLEKELVSFADIVAMKKREKTKRRKYRKIKPSHTEEVRSLVELQMHALKQYLESKQTAERPQNSKSPETYKTGGSEFPRKTRSKSNKRCAYKRKSESRSSSGCHSTQRSSHRTRNSSEIYESSKTDKIGRKSSSEAKRRKHSKDREHKTRKSHKKQRKRCRSRGEKHKKGL